MSNIRAEGAWLTRRGWIRHAYEYRSTSSPVTTVVIESCEGTTITKVRDVDIMRYEWANGMRNPYWRALGLHVRGEIA